MPRRAVLNFVIANTITRAEDDQSGRCSRWKGRVDVAGDLGGLIFHAKRAPCGEISKGTEGTLHCNASSATALSREMSPFPLGIFVPSTEQSCQRTGTTNEPTLFALCFQYYCNYIRDVTNRWIEASNCDTDRRDNFSMSKRTYSNISKNIIDASADRIDLS